MRTRIYKNVFNRLTYELATAEGLFFIERRAVNGLYYINHYCTWCSMITGARLDVGLIFPDEIPPFRSYIQACIYAKKHADSLR